MDRTAEAERELRAAWKADPQLAGAAYNLAVLVSAERLPEAVLLCRKACGLRPDDPKYVYTLAFFLRQSGDIAGAMTQLRQIVDRNAAYPDAYGLLGQLYEENGAVDHAVAVYNQAAAHEQIPFETRRYFAGRAATLSRRPGGASAP
jgi:predicted Zn-dependent protease